MRIFIITETLLPGGAEWFTLRLSKALSEKNHEVYLFVLSPDLVDKRLTEKFEGLKIMQVNEMKIRLAVFMDRVLNRLIGRKYFCQKINSKYLKKKIKAISPDVLHSHLITSDLTTIDANKSFKVRHVTTIHGDYIKSVKGDVIKAKDKLNNAFFGLDHIVSISDEQIRILTQNFPFIKGKLSKVYNGYQLPEKLPSSPAHDTFNFGLIARGIKEKGWEPAIQSFIQIPNENIRLYFYGESDYLKELEQKYFDGRIVFAGFTDNPLLATSTLDVGLLPSYYSSESLPTTIIEYLAMGKPVIATAVGEISNMIGANDEKTSAGILINTSVPEDMVIPMREAMMKMVSDKDAYNAFASNCEPAFKKFDMDKCVDTYVTIYENKNIELCAV